MNKDDALNHVELLLQESLKNFSAALKKHIPYNKTKAKDQIYSHYIPERCLTTYFAHTLISDGFHVFNEQDYCKNGQYGKLDLLARKFSQSNNENEQIQIFVEAKGNLDGCYKEVIHDIHRMQNFNLEFSGHSKTNIEENMFKHQFHVILTTNWWYKTLSEWWTNQDEYPKSSKGGRRTADEWPRLKEKIQTAKCDVVQLIEGEKSTLDALYAIFTKN